MKTKNLISMGMLTALLAACSNELEMPSSVVGNGDAARPSAGKVVIVPNMGEGQSDADTRAYWTGSRWMFKAEDEFGAFLMDDWKGTNEGETTVADYVFTDYVHTNYKYTADGSGKVWACQDDDTPLAGNYFFYFPYKADQKERGFIREELENNQTNFDGTEVRWDYAVEKNQRYLGYAFIPASNQDINNVEVNFYPLFATPKFKLHNLTGGELRLHKLIIRTHQHGPADVPSLLPNKVALAPFSKNFADVAAEYPEMDAKEQIATLFSHSTLVLNGPFAQEAKEGAREEKLDSEYGKPMDERTGVYEYTIDFGENYTVGHDEFFKGCVVMPAGQYYNFDVFALVELPKSGTTGIISLRSLKTADWDAFDTQNSSMQTILKPGIQQVLTASFDAGSIENLGMSDFTVASSEDLEYLLNLKAEDGGTDLMVIKTMGDKVAMTEGSYKWLADEAHKGIKVIINGTIVIPEELPEDAIDQLSTDSRFPTTIINEGKQKVEKPLVADFINKGEAWVADITVNTSGDGITNYGKFTGVKVGGDVTNMKGGELYIIENVATVNNYGLAEVGTEDSAATLWWTFTNYAGGEFYVGGDLSVQKAIDNQAGATMTVANDVTVTDANSTGNYQSITNEGTIFNLGTIYRVWENKGVIYNGNDVDTDATLRIETNTKDGVINNYGHMFDVENNYGNIYMKAGTAKIEFSDATNGEGNIENTLHGDIENIGGQHVIYTATGVPFDEVLATMKTYGKYTDLVIAHNYTLEDGVAVKRTTISSDLDKITIIEGVIVDIAENATVELGWKDAVDVENNGLINVNHGATLKGGEITNNGTIKKNNNATIENDLAAGSNAVEIYD